MRLARSAKGVLRSARNAATASCNFSSICSAVRGWKVSITSPVAGLIVAMAMMAISSCENLSDSGTGPTRPLPSRWEGAGKPSGHATIPLRDEPVAAHPFQTSRSLLPSEPGAGRMLLVQFLNLRQGTANDQQRGPDCAQHHQENHHGVTSKPVVAAGDLRLQD